jgi:hypothetical protein
VATKRLRVKVNLPANYRIGQVVLHEGDAYQVTGVYAHTIEVKPWKPSQFRPHIVAYLKGLGKTLIITAWFITWLSLLGPWGYLVAIPTVPLVFLFL